MAVQIQLDKPRELKFDLRAFRDLEAAMGGTPLAAIVAQLRQLSITGIQLALWAGLKHEDKALNPNLVMRLLEAHVAAGKGLRPLTEALAKAIEETGIFANAADEDDEDAEGNATPEPTTALVGR